MHDTDSDFKFIHDFKFSKAEVIVLLINVLQHNTSFRKLKVASADYILFSENKYVSNIHDLECLAYQLRRGSSGPQHKLKRAYSLPCIMKHNHVLLRSRPWLRRCCSAPDLTLTESISSLHPSLMDTLGISQFYYNHSESPSLLRKYFVKERLGVDVPTRRSMYRTKTDNQKFQ